MIIFINIHGCGCKPEILNIVDLDSLINIIIKKYKNMHIKSIEFKGIELMRFRHNRYKDDDYGDYNDEDDYYSNANPRNKYKRQIYKKYKDININNFDIIDVFTGIVGGGIDNIKDEIDLNIGFDMNLIKRDELYVNLIHFDLKMTNNENYGYFNTFKVNVVGGFYAIDDLDIFKNYLEKIKEKNIPFIVISSGTSGKDIIPICKKYQFIKEVIIFCSNQKYNEHYIKEYPGYVKKVLTSINSVYNYIKTLQANQEFKDNIEYNNYINKYNLFSPEEIKMDKQLQQCPVITASEYDKCYFLVHKAYSHFFGDINNIKDKPEFGPQNFCKILGSLNLINFKNSSSNISLKDQFKKFLSIKENNKFVEQSIREYTRESNFCYLFNRIMRNFESGLISFAYYMGPFLFGVNKYVKENPSFAISKDMTLFRNILCSNIDFYLYKLNLGHIICFPSITSTSSKENNFSSTSLSQQVCNNKAEEMMKIKMIFKYKHKDGNISPGIIIEDKKGTDGNFLSCCPKEKEVILFPFTFARIKAIREETIGGINIHIIELEIINRTSYIEYTLKNEVDKRFLFSNLD